MEIENIPKIKQIIQQAMYEDHSTSASSYDENTNHTIQSKHLYNNNKIYTQSKFQVLSQNTTKSEDSDYVSNHIEIVHNKSQEPKICGFKSIGPFVNQSVYDLNNYSNNDTNTIQITDKFTVQQKIGNTNGKGNGLFSQSSDQQQKNMKRNNQEFFSELFQKFPALQQDRINSKLQSNININNNNINNNQQLITKEEISISNNYPKIEINKKTSTTQNTNNLNNINSNNTNNNLINNNANAQNLENYFTEKTQESLNVSTKEMKRHERNLYPYFSVHFRKSLRDDHQFQEDLKILQIANPVYYVIRIACSTDLRSKNNLEELIKKGDQNINIAIKIWFEKYLSKALEKSRGSKNDHISNTHAKRVLAFKNRGLQVIKLINEFI